MDDELNRECDGGPASDEGRAFRDGDGGGTARLTHVGRTYPELRRAEREFAERGQTTAEEGPQLPMAGEGVRAESQAQKIARIKRELESVPALPGVYLWKDASGQVIYVGKAKQLRARMRQYVNFQDERAKIPLLVDQIDSFDYLVVENEHESLVLEKNLINQHAPFFNADFKDDKSYPFIAVTRGDVFPAIKYTREKHRSDTRYFGPFTDSRAARRHG